MSAPDYQLTEDCYVCLADDRLIFSDTREDRYRCLSKANTQLALRLFGFQGADLTPVNTGHVAAQRQTQQLLQALREKDLLARRGVHGKPFTPLSIPMPTSSLASCSPPAFSFQHLRHLKAFFQASFAASAKFHLYSLRQTVRGVESRRLRSRQKHPQDIHAMQRLAATFHHVRPLYPKNYICRFDSLALIEFLAHYRQFPRWVFGVKGEPFGAHCWVQEDEFLLNDSVAYVRQFTPIMAF